VKLLTLCFITTFVVSLSACGELPRAQLSSPVAQHYDEAPENPSCEKTGDRRENKQPAPHAPIKIVVFQDKTGSANTTRTEQLTELEFASPISLLRCAGGELAVGIVDDVSNTSLARLRIEPPPTLEVEGQASNVFERAQQDAASQQRLNDYNQAVNKWRAETDKRVGVFLAQISKVLQQRPNAKMTNVWSAVSRADLFLSESDATWPRPTRRYAIFNSDGVDTARSKPIAIKSGAQLIVVNGIGSTGVFQSLNPERFESIQAAFQFISAKEMGGK
jgi:hypothetical protein